MKQGIPPDILTKTYLTNKYISQDAHFVILAWEQS